MNFVHPLDGLDAHPWSSFSHAYGPAEDLPDLLRALVDVDVDVDVDGDADVDEADDALSELYGSVLHQGTVYAASAEAVPFLARIAAAGHRTAGVLTLLGGMAESEDEHGVAPGAVRDAVAGQLPLLLPLLDDAETQVRRTAVWAVSHTRATARVLPALRQRWESEADPLVRSEILAGISRLDRAAGADTAGPVLASSQPAAVRMAAVFACLDADLPWTEVHQTTMLSLLPAEASQGDSLDLDRNEPLAAVVEMLLTRAHDADRDGGREADREAVFALLDAALRDDRAEVRSEALWAADRACMLSRSAPRRLLDGLRAAAVDEEAVVAMASLLGRLGAVAAPAAEILLPLAGRDPEQTDDHADRALSALVLLAPAQAAPLLADGLGRRPRALDAAAGFLAPADSTFPFDARLLGAIRHRLAQPGALSGNEPGQLTRLLVGWGARATPALPDLYDTLVHFPSQAARAIAAIARAAAPDERARAERALRAAAEKGSIPVAQGLYDLTDDARPLIDLLEQALRRDGDRARQAAATAVAALGSGAKALAPALRAALGGTGGDTTTPALDVDTALAEALWRVTQDAPAVVAALDSVFARAERNQWSRWSVVRAARVAALLGPAGRPLTARLEAVLDDPEQAPAAILALTAVAEPASLDHTALAETALRSAEREADPTGALDALEALGAAALSPDRLRRLAALTDGDRRVIRSGVEDRVIGGDEAFRVRARRLVTALTAATAQHSRSA
ncbi:HEAT repeat domain-containing protein [Streptomyces sp. NPDC002328]|uniref:HEAT repeat domain-containing protein n=1 Tax=Streptomyces sp. NPDC002328 TaxID=3364642 RepID=UPI0036A39EAE